MSKKEQKEQQNKGKIVAPGYESAIHKPKGFSRKDMGKFKQALNEHEASQTAQARGAAIMEFVSDLASEVSPLRFQRLADLNKGRDTKLTFSDIKNSALEQPIEKCIREFCVVANNIMKSQKGYGNVAVYSEKSVQDLEKLKTRFINEVTALKEKTPKAQADRQYSNSLHTVATNVITKHHMKESENIPTHFPKP